MGTIRHSDTPVAVECETSNGRSIRTLPLSNTRVLGNPGIHVALPGVLGVGKTAPTVATRDVVLMCGELDKWRKLPVATIPGPLGIVRTGLMPAVENARRLSNDLYGI